MSGLRQAACALVVLCFSFVVAGIAAQGQDQDATPASGEELGAGEGTGTAVAGSETWHVSTYVTGPKGFRVIDSWSKGPWMRANTLVSGHPLTTVVRGDRYVVFDAIRGEGLSIGRAPRARAEDATRGRPFGNDLAELIAKGGEKVENTRFRGEEAELWRLTDGTTRRSVWVRRQTGALPIRVEIFERAGAQTVTLDYANWIRGLEIADDFFEVPARITLRRLDYEAYLGLVQAGKPDLLPVLYPDLLHGGTVR